MATRAGTYFPIRASGYKPAPAPYWNELINAQNLVGIGTAGLLTQAPNIIEGSQSLLSKKSAQDVIDSHLSQENNYKTWDFGYKMSEADARAKGYIIPPEPTVTEEERKRSLTLPNIPPDIDLPQHTGDTSGQQVELPQHTGSPPVEWDFPIHTGDTSPPYVPTLDDYILRSETDEGLLQDDKVTSGILDETAPPFYSKIKKTIEDAKMEKGSAEQWKGYINNAGVNQEELDWIGLKDYLADKKSVTKEDVLNFVEMNDLAVQVKDIVLGAESDAIRFTGDTMEMIEGQGTTLTWDSRVPEILRNAAGYQDAKNILHNDDELYNQLQNYYSDYYIKKNNLKYPKDFEDLDENDFDILKKNFLKDNFGIVRGSSDQGKTMFNKPELITEGDYTDYKEMVFQLPVEGSEFIKSHYSKYPNTFAHARFNTRDVDGKKTLFIEELQSDWVHKGKESGYQTKEYKKQQEELQTKRNKILDERTNLHKEIDKLNDQSSVYAGSIDSVEIEKLQAPIRKKINELTLELKEVDSKFTDNLTNVPDIPFKKNWQDIVLKRLIRYASENGFDAIAMTGGNIQADRYDLSNHIDSISIKKSERADGKIYLQAISKDQGTVALDHHIYPDQLEEYIGKDLAKKIKNDLPDLDKMKNNTVEGLDYSGLDLKIGGEGLKSMYDKIFSKSLNKIGKKFDAKLIEKVQSFGKFRTKENEFWFMDLTPSMKKKAIEAGFPIAYNKPVNPLFQFA